MDLSNYGIDKNNKLLEIALTHSSYANEHKLQSYERLEFLGDAVLELIISEYLFKEMHLKEGEMTKIRSRYVCEEALDEYAKSINLKDYIKVSSSFDEPNASVIADVFEAVIAVIYLSKGFSPARKFVMDIAKPYIDKNVIFLSDYKSYLQELVQTEQKTVEYKVVKTTGPAHDRTFEVEAIIDNIVYAKGFGKSKKAAEQDAAKKTIKLSAGVK